MTGKKRLKGHGPEHTQYTQLQQFIGNVQGDGRKFKGHFICHFGPQISSESLKRGDIRSSECMKPTFATKVTDSVCK